LQLTAHGIKAALQVKHALFYLTPNKNLIMKKIYLVLWILQLVGIHTSVQAQVNKIYGNAQDNYPTAIKAFNNAIYVSGYRISGGMEYGTFSKYDMTTGVDIWEKTFERQGRILDFDYDPTSDKFLLVGHEQPFNTTLDNTSVMVILSSDGTTTQIFNRFSHPGREAFTRVIRHPNPLNAAYPFYVLGTKNPSSTVSAIDVPILYNVSATGSLNWQKEYDYAGSSDDEFVKGLFALPNGNIMITGNETSAANGGIISEINGSTGVPVTNRSLQLRSNFSIYDGLVLNGTDLVLVGQDAANQEAVVMVYNLTTLALVTARRFPYLINFKDIWVDNTGKLYTLGENKILTISGNLQVITKMTYASSTLTTNWCKLIDGNVLPPTNTATTFANGNIYVTPANNQIFYADARTLSSPPVGLGGKDMLLGAFDLDITSFYCKTPFGVLSNALSLTTTPITITDATVTPSFVTVPSIQNYITNFYTPCVSPTCDFSVTLGDCFQAQFTSTPMPAGTYTFEWDIYCDNTIQYTSTGTTSTYNHTFPCGGTFQVCLRVKTANGETFCHTQQTVVIPNTCCGSITSSTAVCTNTACQYAFTINVAPPTVATTCTPSLVFNNSTAVGSPGYTVTPASSGQGWVINGLCSVPCNNVPSSLSFTVNFSCGTCEILPISCRLPVTITTPTCNPPNCDIIVTPSDCFNVQFTATATPPGTYTYVWDIGCDGAVTPDITTNTPVLNHTFPCGGGTYQVCLKIMTTSLPSVVFCQVIKTVTISNDCCGTITSAIAECTKTPCLFTFKFTVVPPAGITNCAPTVTFINSAANGTPGYTVTQVGSNWEIEGGSSVPCNNVPKNLSYLVSFNCVCPVTGLPIKCNRDVIISTPCCKPIQVGNYTVCKTVPNYDVPILPLYWGPLMNITNVTWYALPKPITGCPTPPWTGVGATPYQVTTGNVLEPLHLHPDKLIGDVCVYAVVTLNDGNCTVLTSNVASISLCQPSSYTLTNFQYCYAGTPVQPTILGLTVTPTPACEEVVSWLDPAGQPIGGTTGNYTYLPPPLSMTDPTQCYQDFIYTMRITDDCGVRNYPTRVRLFSQTALIGTLAINPLEPYAPMTTLCNGEDLTLTFTPNCASTNPPLSPTWTWFTHDCNTPISSAVNIPNSGNMNSVFNTNRLTQSVWYGVKARNGVCAANIVEKLIEVKNLTVINSFTDATTDACLASDVRLRINFTGCSLECTNGACACDYQVEWFKDGVSIGTTTAFFATGGNLIGGLNYSTQPLAGNYYAVLKTCCNEILKTSVITVAPICAPKINGPCFICRTQPVVLTGEMVLPVNQPCPSGANCTFLWSVVSGTGGVISSGSLSSPSITVTAAGTYQLTTTCTTPYGTCVRSVQFVLLQGCPNTLLSAKAFLQGPYSTITSGNSTAGLMNDDLRRNNLIPTREPYSALARFTHMGGGGGETTTPSVLAVTGNNAIVDWVFIQLRDKNNASTVLATRAALLQRDGDIVDVDGTSPVTFNIAPDNYFVAIRHRNHLGARTANPVAIPNTATSLDFTTATTPSLFYGTNPQKGLGNGKLGLYMGNVIQDGILKYSGSNNDRLPILTKIGGSNIIVTVSGYFVEDCNMDGVVKYSGSSNDRLPILTNIGGTNITATVAEQL
jgi:hypothetical protein